MTSRCQTDNLSVSYKKGNVLNTLLTVFNKLPKNAVGGGVEPPTMRLAKIQKLVVNPSRPRPALHLVYP